MAVHHLTSRRHGGGFHKIDGFIPHRRYGGPSASKADDPDLPRVVQLRHQDGYILYDRTAKTVVGSSARPIMRGEAA